MTHCQFFRLILLSTVFVGASITAAQDPVIYTDDRTTSTTFRDRGTSYAPTYLIYVDKQRTADDAKQLIDDLGFFCTPPTARLSGALMTAVGVQRSIWSSIQISLRDSLIGSSRCVAVMAISICTVRGVSTNCADRNDVTGYGSPMGMPVELSNRRAHTFATPVRFDTKYRMRPSGPHRGLSSNHAPSVIARQAPPAVGIT
jgi:hypothetical protein